MQKGQSGISTSKSNLPTENGQYTVLDVMRMNNGLMASESLKN